MVTKVATAKQAIKRLRKSSHECIDCNQPVTVPTMQPGMMWAQGDVGVLRIAELPRGAKKAERTENGQVAPGNTQGSRHCVREEQGVTWYRFGGDGLSDIAIEADRPWTLTHPEHAHCTFEPGLYQFIHEQNEQNQRVRD